MQYHPIRLPGINKIIESTVYPELASMTTMLANLKTCIETISEAPRVMITDDVRDNITSFLAATRKIDTPVNDPRRSKAGSYALVWVTEEE